jgi:hypothetical protein
MPDSFPPPTWGPPFDERNLDALLSGHLADPPQALRQVADALAALRAAPTPAELTGEAAARAEFRALADSLALGLDEAARTDGHPYAEVLSALTLDGTGRPPARHRSIRRARGTGPGGPPRGLPGGPTGPHRARPRGRRLGRKGGVLIAAASGALVVAVIALAATMPGSAHRGGSSSAAGAPSSGHSSGGTTPSQNVQAGSASPEPSNQATPTHAAHHAVSPPPTSSAQSEARRLCRDFYEYFSHPRPRDWPAEQTLFRQIARLAGDPSPFDVDSYCGPYVRDMFPHGLPPIPGSLQGLLSGPPAGAGNDRQAPNSGDPVPGTMNGIPVNN